MSFIKYNITYQSTSNDVLVETVPNDWSATISSATELILIDDKITIPISETTQLKLSYNEFNLINGSTIYELGLTTIETIYSYLNEKCFSEYAFISKKLSTTIKATIALTKGTPVYVSGANGTNILVSKAGSSTELTSSKTLGLIAQDLQINGIGEVITYGLLDGLNTSSATIGDPVWLGSTDGTLLYGIANKPKAPQHLVYIGVVTRVNANNGEIFVKVQNGFEIDELHDVLIENISNNDILQYESLTGLWKNKPLSNYNGELVLNGTGFVKSTNGVISYDNSTYITGITNNNIISALGYTPISTSGGTINGTLGSGFLGFNAQSISPATPSSGFRIFANSTGLFSWEGTNGFVRTFDDSSNTADRNYTLPDASGTFGLLGSNQNWAGVNTFNGIQQISGLSTQWKLYNPSLNGVEVLNIGVGKSETSGNTTLLGWANNNGSPFGYLETYSGGSPLILQRGTGNVLIGTIINSGYKLDVNGTTRITGDTRITPSTFFEVFGESKIRLNRAGSYFWDIGTNFVGLLSNFSIFDASASSHRLFITHTIGNVGINTTTPTSRFHVSGSQAGTLLSVSTATTLGEQRFIIVTAGVALTLPTASTCNGRTYTINTRSAGVTISSYTNLSGTSGQTSIANGTSITLVSDGTNWQQVQ